MKFLYAARGYNRAVSCVVYLADFSDAVTSCEQAPASNSSAAKATRVASITAIVCTSDEKDTLKVCFFAFQQYSLKVFFWGGG